MNVHSVPVGIKTGNWIIVEYFESTNRALINLGVAEISAFYAPAIFTDL